ncbi:MAG: Ppx/GppA phosphatase family protein [Alphaproteobacteria bacterium]|nr:Ppx/GppA phosphatase family protein [Alphaproteobacteria bacterium]
MRKDRLAVIDVGSNSVRMVVYPTTALAAPPLFNEKAMCGLGREQAPGGALAAGAMQQAIDTIARFAHVANAMGVGAVDAAATAAVREASNRDEFLDRVRAETGVSVRVLSGVEEARLSARGVLAASPGAHGLVCDLGGGSLDLMNLRPDRPEGLGQGVSLPLGTLRLASLAGGDSGGTDQYIDDNLAAVKWLDEIRDGDLYIVGGAWRSLGRLEMARNRYPLRVLHGYTLPADRVVSMCQLFAGLGLESLQRIEAAPQDRLDDLPWAARVLGRLLRLSGAKRVIFSAYGLREGMLQEHLSPEQLSADPLLASCRLTAQASAWDAENGLGHGHGDGGKLSDWLAPLFPNESVDEGRLRLAAGLLSEIGWRIHPDERPDHAMADVLRAPLIGLDHTQRIKLALAIRFRYTHKRDSRWVERYGHLIEEEDRIWSRRVGQALRLAHTLCGGVMALLAQYRLSMDNDAITLHCQPETGHLIGEAARKRLSAMARSFDRKGSVATD